MVLSAWGAYPGTVPAATIGSDLQASPNGSVCAFDSLEPETRSCTVGQFELSPTHTASDGLVAPFDGVVTEWSVIGGAAPPGTGSVKLALRITSFGHYEKGPEVDLPLGPPGVRYTYPASMRIAEGQKLGLKISVSNRRPLEAGAPLAFKESAIGETDTWTFGDAEPWGTSIRGGEESTELLFAAVVEPDQDKDGLGDLTQDCFPSHPFDQQFCGRDLRPPGISRQVDPYQRFLRSGVVVARVSSDEAGTARATGLLTIKGNPKRTFGLRRARTPIAQDASVVLRLRVQRGALQLARNAAREGHRVFASVHLSVTDAGGLVNEKRAIVRPVVARHVDG